MIFMYNKIWPDHPFLFRVPYQHIGQTQDSKRVEYWHTPADIKSTVLALLGDLPDEEIVYWCIDDNYPIKLDCLKISEIQKSITGNRGEQISGIAFCRRPESWKRDYMTGNVIKDSFGNTLLEKRDYRNIWLHQFLRVKVLRHFFSSMPNEITHPRLMDKHKTELKKPSDHRLFVSKRSLAIFGESTIRGVITKNCYDSLVKNGLRPPEWATKTTETEILVGNLSISNILKMFKYMAENHQPSASLLRGILDMLGMYKDKGQEIDDSQ